MKRVYILTLLTLTVAVLHSCTKDSESQPGGIKDYSSGYETSQAALTAAESLYHSGAPAFYGECASEGVPVAMIGGYLSGYFDSEAGAAGMPLYESCRSLSLENGTVSNYATHIWDKAYKAIAVCNELIARVPHTPDLTNEQIAGLIAEARFFRAFNYFYLARSFGDVPIVTQSGDNTQGNSSLKEVYTLVVNDLKQASEWLPDEAFARNGFRATRPAALTMLSDVYLTMSGWPLQQDCYEQAAKAAMSVIESGKHMLASNGATPDVSAYNILRTQNDHAEYIYSYHGASLFAFSLPKESSGWGVIKTGTGGSYMPTGALMNAYDPYFDMRGCEQQFFHSFVTYGKNNRTIIQTFTPKPFWWFDHEALFETGSTGRGVAIYRYAEVYRGGGARQNRGCNRQGGGLSGRCPFTGLAKHRAGDDP